MYVRVSSSIYRYPYINTCRYSVCLSVIGQRDRELFSPALPHGEGAWTPQPVQHYVQLMSRRNVNFPPHPGTIRSHSRIILVQYILPYAYESINSGTKTDTPQVDTAPQGVETPTPRANF